MFEFPVFSHPTFGAVRVVEYNGEPWFVAKDVASALGYAESSNPARLFQSVPEEWKGVKQIHTLGGEQQILTISEQGLYFFLGRSDKPGALPFQKWLAGEVIPAIRKHGGYLTPAKIEEALSDPDTIIKLATTLKEERAQRHIAEAQRDEAIRLTTASACGILNFPNYRRRSRRLCVAPQREKSGFSCFCHQSTSRGVGYILAEQRPGVREAPAAFDKPGSVVLPFFVSNPKIIEVHHVY